MRSEQKSRGKGEDCGQTEDQMSRWYVSKGNRATGDIGHSSQRKYWIQRPGDTKTGRRFQDLWSHNAWCA